MGPALQHQVEMVLKVSMFLYGFVSPLTDSAEGDH